MRKTLCLLLSGMLVTAEFAWSVASAQTLPDAEPPVVELQSVASGQAGTAQVFTAQVTDNRELVDVILYHRRAGRQPFTALPMQALGRSAFYSATIATRPADARAIEYYVQARDGGGNRTVDGYAFDPHVRTLRAAPAVAEQTMPPADPTRTVSGSQESAFGGGRVSWWQIALGAVAVGTLAAIAGSSSGSDGSRDDATVPLTVNLTEPR